MAIWAPNKKQKFETIATCEFNSRFTANNKNCDVKSAYENTYENQIKELPDAKIQTKFKRAK